MKKPKVGQKSGGMEMLNYVVHVGTGNLQRDMEILYI